MSNDPIVDEIRAIRDAYAKRFNYDLQAIFEDLKRREATANQDLVSFPPKRIDSKDESAATGTEGGQTSS